MNNWKTNVKFRDFVRMFPKKLTEYIIYKLVEDFFKCVHIIHTKRFTHWRNTYLYLSLAGDCTPAIYLATWILGGPLHSLALGDVSFTHNATIIIVAVFVFISLNNTPENQRQKEYFRNHCAAIKLIAEGKDMWIGDSDYMHKCGIYVKHN